MSYPVTMHGPMPSADWTAQNPTLAQFELGYETDTGKMKMGPGLWNSLGYLDPARRLTVPEVPATPTAQDVVDALLTLGLVTQATP